MTIKELRKQTGLSQSKFAAEFHIALKTLQSWEQGVRKPSESTLFMLERLIISEDKKTKNNNVK